ncbi:MAG: hypothetical protein RID53_31400 [Coleofasciculus sp. B1-GNL1-01]
MTVVLVSVYGGGIIIESGARAGKLWLILKLTQKINVSVGE